MSRYDPYLHKRNSIRLKGYDYSQPGLYFVTICVRGKMHLFGKIVNDKLELNVAGKMIETEWLRLQKKFTRIKLYEYVVMPNHFHAILKIQSITSTMVKSSDSKKITLGSVIGAFKSTTTRKYINGVKNNNWESFDKKLWQRNYFEHIIRDKKSYYEISKYIIDNPKNWKYDELNELNELKDTSHAPWLPFND